MRPPFFSFFQKHIFAALLLFTAIPLHASFEGLSTASLVIVPITNGYYCDFLNSTSHNDLHDLHDMMMVKQGAIWRCGVPGNYFYKSEEDQKNALVHFVSKANQVRFCHWVEHGCPADVSETENGAYDFTENAFVKNNQDACSIFNDAAAAQDVSLKSNSATFSIVAPAELLGTMHGTPYNGTAQAAADEEIVISLGDSIMDALFTASAAFGGAAGVRGMTGKYDETLERMHSAPLTSRTENSEEILEFESSSSLTDASVSSQADERNNSLFVQQWKTTKRAHAAAETHYKDACAAFATAQFSFDEYQSSLSHQSNAAAKVYNGNAHNHLIAQQKANELWTDYHPHHDWWLNYEGQAIQLRYDPQWIAQAQQIARGKLVNLQQQRNEVTQWNGVLLQSWAQYQDLTSQLQNIHLSVPYQNREHAKREVEEIQKNLTDHKNRLVAFQKMESSADHIFHHLQQQWRPLENTISINQKKNFFVDCIDAIKNLSWDNTAVSHEEAILEILSQKIESLKSEIRRTESDLLTSSSGVILVPLNFESTRTFPVPPTPGSRGSIFSAGEITALEEFQNEYRNFRNFSPLPSRNSTALFSRSEPPASHFTLQRPSPADPMLQELGLLTPGPIKEKNLQHVQSAFEQAPHAREKFEGTTVFTPPKKPGRLTTNLEEMSMKAISPKTIDLPEPHPLSAERLRACEELLKKRLAEQPTNRTTPSTDAQPVIPETTLSVTSNNSSALVTPKNSSSKKRHRKPKEKNLNAAAENPTTHESEIPQAPLDLPFYQDQETIDHIATPWLLEPMLRTIEKGYEWSQSVMTAYEKLRHTVNGMIEDYHNCAAHLSVDEGIDALTDKWKEDIRRMTRKQKALLEVTQLKEARAQKEADEKERVKKPSAEEQAAAELEEKTKRAEANALALIAEEEAAKAQSQQSGKAKNKSSSQKSQKKNKQLSANSPKEKLLNNIPSDGGDNPTTLAAEAAFIGDSASSSTHQQESNKEPLQVTALQKFFDETISYGHSVARPILEYCRNYMPNYRAACDNYDSLKTEVTKLSQSLPLSARHAIAVVFTELDKTRQEIQQSNLSLEEKQTKIDLLTNKYLKSLEKVGYDQKFRTELEQLTEQRTAAAEELRKYPLARLLGLGEDKN